ncbi:MAG TPA: glycogen synthase GlgA [Halanaerobiales bacterium]|nr:glycogen synthase GlgA [Halanaerobiales bacterium]
MSDKLKILFVSPEVSPFIKTGGLADVAGALPRELKKRGHDVRVVLPEYKKIPDRFVMDFEHVTDFRMKMVWRDKYVGVNKLIYKDVPTYFIDNKYYFFRESIYENGDKGEQYAFFSRAVLEMINKIDFKPDIIHCNDWQTGPLSLMLKDNYQIYDFYRDIRTVFSIHNLAYQGKFDPSIVGDVLGVSNYHLTSGNIRHNNMVNFMKTGIMYSDIINTVSETYAEEIKNEYYGEDLDYILRMRDNDLYGILNGIDYEEFNPATDDRIYYNYDKENLDNKYKNKLSLQKDMNLKPDEDVPVISIITRLVEQKGIDLLPPIIDELMQQDLQFIILGTGQPQYEDFFRYISSRYPDKISANIKYDAKLAQKIYAGSDMFLMPSRFEPCGLGQLISMRYGTIPIIKETGGLKDTVIPYNEYEDTGYGFTFSDYNAHDLFYTVQRALSFYNEGDVWEELVKRVMVQDYSWEKSARKYEDLYSKLVIDKKAKPKVSKKASKKININKAKTKELITLKGIGNSYAERVVEYRKKKGKFKTKKELMNIKGIGKSKYNKLKDKIRI